jgi:hypothetical protein
MLRCASRRANFRLYFFQQILEHRLNAYHNKSNQQFAMNDRGFVKTFLEKWGLMLRALLFVLPLVGLKIFVHHFGFEFLTVGTLTSALVGGVFFVVAIILAGVMSDFKEAEKMLAELGTSIDNLVVETQLIGSAGEVVEIGKLAQDLVRACINNLTRLNSWKMGEIQIIIDKFEAEVRRFNGEGKQISVLLRLRTELSNIKRISSRIDVIKETTFLPAAHTIAEVGITAIILVLVFSKIEPFYEGVFFISTLSLILTSIVILINDIDNPFSGYAKVDIRVIEKLARHLDEEQITNEKTQIPIIPS